MKLWTIGTSKRSMEEFLSLLEAYRIEVIADVRRFPTSKFKRFQQENLEASLNHRGIDYHHIVELGGYRKGGYKKYMETEDFDTGLCYVEQLASANRVAIMCAELLFSQCHRRFIADALHLRGHAVIHIIDDKRSDEHRSRAGEHRGKTLDAFFSDLIL